MPVIAAIGAFSFCLGLVVLTIIVANERSFAENFLPLLIFAVSAAIAFFAARHLLANGRLKLLLQWLIGVSAGAFLFFLPFGLSDASRGNDALLTLALILLAVSAAGVFAYRAKLGSFPLVGGMKSSALADIFKAPDPNWIDMQRDDGRVSFHVRQKRSARLRNAIVATLASFGTALVCLATIFYFKDTKDPAGVLLILVALAMVVGALVGVGCLFGILANLRWLKSAEQVRVHVTPKAILLEYDKAQSPTRLEYDKLLGPYYVTSHNGPQMPAIASETVMIGGGTGLSGMVAAGMVGAKGAIDSAASVLGISMFSALNYIAKGTQGSVHVDYLGRKYVLAGLLDDDEARFLAEKIAEAIVELRARPEARASA